MNRAQGCFVYLLASAPNETLYLGVTSDLIARVHQHRNGALDGFTKDHGCTLLVWYEVHDDLQNARARELQMKKWKRAWKLRIVEDGNPQWCDLFETLV